MLRQTNQHTPARAAVLAAVLRSVGNLEFLNITIWDFTGRKDSSGNQRESATLFPQGLSLYSRRAVPLFPQGCPFIPAGLALYSRRASAGAPGIQLLPGLRRRRWPGSVPPGMRARDDSALTEVGCCPQAAAACKLRGSPRPGP
jgi:hypothetical protein